MKLNRNVEIKYVPKQAYKKVNVPFMAFMSLFFFHEIWFSTCHKSMLSQHNTNSRIVHAKQKKMSPNVNIQKCTKSKINIQVQIQTSN